MSYCGTLLVDFFSQVAYSQIGMTNIGTLHDFVNGTLIPEASKMIDSYCGHTCGTFTVGTLYFDGTGKSVLFVPPKYTPLIGVSAGTVDSSAITATDLKIHDQFIEWDGGVFNTGKLNVILHGSYGYATTPKDIEFVCAQLCANVLNDMVRRKVFPDAFLKMMEAGGADAGALMANSSIFTKALKEQLDEYKVTWVEMG